MYHDHFEYAYAPTQHPQSNLKCYMTKKIYFLEDLSLGQRFHAGRAIMDEVGIKDFASQFDPQPFHLDDELAKDTVFQGLVASGWHTAAVAMRLLVDSDFKTAGGLVGAGLDGLKWTRPVRAGDELSLDLEIVDIRPSKSRPDQGMVKLQVKAFNQRQEEVLSYVANLVVKKKVGFSQ